MEDKIFNNIAHIYYARGDYETARRYLEESLAICRAIGNQSGEGNALNNLSTLYYVREDYDAALRYLEQSLTIRRTLGDRVGLCVTLFNMGHLYGQKDEPQQAIACCVVAYRIAKAIGYAEILAALENLARQLGGSGLGFWEQLSQRMVSGE